VDSTPLATKSAQSAQSGSIEIESEEEEEEGDDENNEKESYNEIEKTEEEAKI